MSCCLGPVCLVQVDTIRRKKQAVMGVIFFFFFCTECNDFKIVHRPKFQTCDGFAGQSQPCWQTGMQDPTRETKKLNYKIKVNNFTGLFYIVQTMKSLESRGIVLC